MPWLLCDGSLVIIYFCITKINKEIKLFTGFVCCGNISRINAVVSFDF